MGKSEQRGQNTVKRQNKKVPHMTFRLTGDKNNKSKSINQYLGSNRQGKRDQIRKQKRSHINQRLETTKGAFGQSKMQKVYNEWVKYLSILSTDHNTAIRIADQLMDDYVLECGLKSFVNDNKD